MAYRQFCQHFLAPLALMSYRDVRLGQLLRVHLDGVPLDLAAELLPTRAKSRPPLLMHVFAHAKSQTKHSGDAQAGDGPTGSAAASASRRSAACCPASNPACASSRGTRAAPRGRATTARPTTTTSEAADHKRALVEEYLEARRRPRPCGTWAATPARSAASPASRASRRCASTSTRGCVEVELPRGRREGPAQPAAPGHGPHQPQPVDRVGQPGAASLKERGPADMAFALALVHHLAIGNNVPLAAWCRAHFAGSCTWLAIEFVPKSDPKVGVLLASREDVFPGLHAGRVRARLRAGVRRAAVRADQGLGADAVPDARQVAARNQLPTSPSRTRSAPVPREADCRSPRLGAGPRHPIRPR